MIWMLLKDQNFLVIEYYGTSKACQHSLFKNSQKSLKSFDLVFFKKIFKKPEKLKSSLFKKLEKLILLKV